MKNKPIYKKRRKKALKWIVGIVVFMMGLASFENYLLTGCLLVLLGIYILPPIQNLLERRFQVVIPTFLKYVIVIGGFVLAGYLKDFEQQNIDDEADKIVQTSISAISKDNFTIARNLLDKADRLYQSDDNKATEIEDMLSKLNSESFLKTSLLNLSEEEFNSLKESNLNRTILENDTLNSLLIAKMHENAGSRAKFIKEKEKQERLERERELERQREARAAARKKKIEDQFSAWDGSHRKLEDYIEKNMHDPDSYEHVETVYWDRGDHLVVRTTFRGNNAFGGKVKNSVKAKVSIENGTILQILSQ